MSAILTPVSISSLPADQRTCAICQEAFGGRDAGATVKTRCNHVFDRNCISQWLGRDNTTCPICRQEIVGGGGILDRFRGVGRVASRAREREEEEREQMRQAQADYGDSDDESSRAPGHSINSRHPNHSLPVRSASHSYNPRVPRRQDSSGNGGGIERAQSDYADALARIERLDREILDQAQVAYRANDRHHQAERNIQRAFARLDAMSHSDNEYEMERALAMQDSVTPLLDEAHHALEREGARLIGMIGDREEADRRLTRAREAFAVERDQYMRIIRRRFTADGRRIRYQEYPPRYEY